MSSEEIFDHTSMFCALFMEPIIKKKDAASVQRTIKRANAGSQMFFELACARYAGQVQLSLITVIDR